MTYPVWTTTAGKLASINEREFYQKNLVATLPGQLPMPGFDSPTTLKFTKIAGELPPGLKLSPKGILQGVPFEVATRKIFRFVIRAQDQGSITSDLIDRTFTLEVLGADAPIFATGSGQIDLSGISTITGTKWIVDGTEVTYQILATDTDTATGQSLAYDIVEGSLPSGLTISETGLISGIVQLAEDEKYAPRGGWSYWDYDESPVGYDPTTYTKSRSINYEFTVRVTDGTSVSTQLNSIFVVTADWWRIDNTDISIDQSIYAGSPLTIDFSAWRRPVFTTKKDLGAHRHDNEIVIRVDVEDFDPLQADLTYSIISGALPTGLSIDPGTGEIFGKLPTQAAVTVEHTFTIRALRITGPGTNVFTDKDFIMNVYGQIDVGVAFVTPEDLGTVPAGMPSLKSLVATAAGSNRVLRYTVTEGILPPGLTLSPQGNIIGIPQIADYTNIDNNATTYDTNTTSLDREYSFIVEVSDQYKALATTRTFKLKITLPYAYDYGNLEGHGTSMADKNIFYQVAQDPNINNNEYIFRSEDPSFGIKDSPRMLLVAGLKPTTLKLMQQQIEQNHEPKTLYFGDLKTAVAKQDGKVVYEVVYIEMKDPLVNALGKAVASEVPLRTTVSKSLLGPVGDDAYITADAEEYNVTTDNGLSFSVSGSKVRYANELSADLGYVTKLYPNAMANMRSQIKSLGHKEWLHLPLWMRTPQTGTGAPIGHTPAVILAYCNPGKSALVKNRILSKAIDFKKVQFTIDRYVVGSGITSPTSFAGNGTTKTFTMNHIINSQDVEIAIDNAVVADASVDNLTIFAGNSTYTVDILPSTGVLSSTYDVTADNLSTPGYLLSDTTIRSADLQNPYTLSHDLINKKTSITFSKAPDDKSKITVSYKGDKYLIFRKKGI